jgi:hypothetical protein
MKKGITLAVLFGLAFAPAFALAESSTPPPSVELDRDRGPDPGPDRDRDPGPDRDRDPGPDRDRDPGPDRDRDPGPDRDRDPGPDRDPGRDRR